MLILASGLSIVLPEMMAQSPSRFFLSIIFSVADQSRKFKQFVRLPTFKHNITPAFKLLTLGVTSRENGSCVVYGGGRLRVAVSQS